ncbi:MAG: HNH endonuclease [Burkholderiales bacterium]|nr:HNH endonuclease [Burkholderiales bacterium]
MDQITKAWEVMEVDLGREGFFDLFTHIRAILRKTKAKESLLDELTADLKKMSVIDFFDRTLSQAKEAFAGIRDADYRHDEHGKAVNAHLEWLNRIEFKDWVPPAIAFWIRHHKDGAAMLRFFSDLARLAYSMVIRRESDNPRIARFGELTRTIEEGNDLFGEESRLQLTPSEQFETYAVLAGDFYLLVKSAPARRTVLLRLDSLIADAASTYDHPIISVEHVLPQNPDPGSEWLTWFTTPDERSKWTHKIGNLALLAKSTNSAARNYPFAMKKEKYFKRKHVTTFSLTVQVLAVDAWTPQAVSKRQEHLLGVLEAHWRLGGRMSTAEQILAALNDL